MREFTQSFSLTVLLAGLLTLALLPIGAVGIWQTRAVISDADKEARDGVLARTLDLASNERNLLQRAVGASSGLGAMFPELAYDQGACSRAMQNFVAEQQDFVFAGWIETSGRMVCHSENGEYDFSSQDNFQKLVENPEISFEVNRQGSVTGQSVIIVSQPVFRDEILQGFVSVSIPHWVASMQSDELTEQGIVVALVDNDGEILASSVGLEKTKDFLPTREQKALFFGQTGNTFVGKGVAGETRFFAVSELLPDQVVVIGSWPEDVAQLTTGNRKTLLTLAFPVLMWVAGLGVALWGLYQLVLRHLTALRSGLSSVAGGERKPLTALQSAPQEFQDVQRDFNNMVELVSAAEARQEEDLQEKTVLLREVHHRVKNNLQLVASIMNMHGRTASTPEARRLLNQLQRRVRGLATVHNTLNTKSQMTTVDTKELIEHLVRELGQRPPIDGRTVEIESDVVSIDLGQDQAVTLSMLVAEALTNAVKYVGIPEGGKPEIEISLTKDASGHIHFTLRNTRGLTADEEDTELLESSGIGQRLMRAFVEQLEGEVDVTDAENEYVYRVSFPIRAIQTEQPPVLRSEGADNGHSEAAE